MYTQISKVRELSGFDNSTKISDSVVLGKISIAESMLDAAISERYTLPLQYHRQNTLVFSGTGSGSGTLSVVINGTAYAVAITLNLTAAQAADLFRTACASSADFITDLAWGSATVVIISKSTTLVTANAQVNITSAGTANGITGTIGTRYDRYPPLVDQITAEIASALLLQDNYGVEAEDTPKDGNLKLKNLSTSLLRLQGADKDGLMMRIIDEVTKIEILESSGTECGFFPDDTSDEDEDDPTAHKLGINDKF